MRDACEYRFVIDAHTPDTLPMSRLAEYMAALARLFGNAKQVHFVALSPAAPRLCKLSSLRRRPWFGGGFSPSQTPMSLERRHTGSSCSTCEKEMKLSEN